MICSKTSFSEIRYPVRYKKTLGQMGEGRHGYRYWVMGGGHDGLTFLRYMEAVIWGGVWYLGYTAGTVKYIKGH